MAELPTLPAVRCGYLVLPDGSTRDEHPDTLAMLHSLFGSDVLMNNTSGRYLSDHIEELIAKRVKQEREAAAKACEEFGASYDNEWNRKLGVASDLKDACDECAAAIRARSG